MCICRPRAEPSRRQAERTFDGMRQGERPGVLLMVIPRTRRVEVVTSPAAASRVSDDDCVAAVAAMAAKLRHGDLAGGVEAGLATIVEAAGRR